MPRPVPAGLHPRGARNRGSSQKTSAEPYDRASCEFRRVKDNDSNNYDAKVRCLGVKYFCFGGMPSFDGTPSCGGNCPQRGTWRGPRCGAVIPDRDARNHAYHVHDVTSWEISRTSGGFMHGGGAPRSRWEEQPPPESTLEAFT